MAAAEVDGWVGLMTTTNERSLPTNGRWLGNRGIFRHHVPDVEHIDPKAGAVLFHTMVTAFSYDTGGAIGELIRWPPKRMKPHARSDTKYALTALMSTPESAMSPPTASIASPPLPRSRTISATNGNHHRRLPRYGLLLAAGRLSPIRPPRPPSWWCSAAASHQGRGPRREASSGVDNGRYAIPSGYRHTLRSVCP
jgi:hypothetical protein